MTVHQSAGIVLHTRDFGESDRLVTLYTRDGGKIRGIAKGARRSKRRFVHAFELFSLVQVGYRVKRSLVWIESCRLEEPFLELRKDLRRWGYAALMSEAVLELLPEADPQEEVFLLLREALARLTAVKDPLNLGLLFLLRLLSLAGYLPAFERCRLCGEALGRERVWYWSMSRGDLTCGRHHVTVSDRLRVDLGTLLLIQRLRDFDLDKMWRFRLHQDIKVPLLQHLVRWLQNEIRCELRSTRLLGQVGFH